KDLKFKNGEVRQGVIIRKDNNFSYVEAGLESLIKVKKTNLPLNKRLNFKIFKIKGQLIGRITDEPNEYWGYRVVIYNKDLISTLQSISAELVIGTSKYGEAVNSISQRLREELKNKNSIAVVFGSPFKGILDMVKNKNQLNLTLDYLINFIPNQATKTVRTEEAIFSVLSIINYLIHEKS
ncbi:MAG: putative RNA uridine N3 methyltransferase, partial [Candidatus Odinarchaeia archaeon]